MRELRDVADIRVVHCTVDADIGRERLVRRAPEPAPSRVSHPDREVLEAIENGTMRFEDFDAIAKEFPSIRVDTTEGYVPHFEQIVIFAGGATV